VDHDVTLGGDLGHVGCGEGLGSADCDGGGLIPTAGEIEGGTGRAIVVESVKSGFLPLKG
jgi:hypothetical protein